MTFLVTQTWRQTLGKAFLDDNRAAAYSLSWHWRMLCTSHHTITQQPAQVHVCSSFPEFLRNCPKDTSTGCQTVCLVCRQCVSYCMPGRTLRQLHHLSIALLSQGIADLGLCGSMTAAAISQTSYSLFYPHSVGRPQLVLSEHWFQYALSCSQGPPDTVSAPYELASASVPSICSLSPQCSSSSGSGWL